MARTYSWARGVVAFGTTAQGRARIQGPTYPPGSTLERVIFGYSLWHDFCAESFPFPPTKLVHLVGLISVDSGAANPDFDPGNTPGADWLWAGMISAKIEPLRVATQDDYRVQFATPAGQLETITRRTNSSGGADRIWLITDQLGSLGAGDNNWEGVAYISVLYSQP